MDNPAAVFDDDQHFGYGSTGSSPPGRGGPVAAGGQQHGNEPSAQQQPTQHFYRRNASTYSLDIPATMGLMSTGSGGGANGSTSSTIKLTEYSSAGSSNSGGSQNGSVGGGDAGGSSAGSPYTISSGVAAGTAATEAVNGQQKSGSGPYDPFKNRDKSKATTNHGALLHLIKSSLGSGILAMPNAFKNGGLIFSLFGTMAIGVLCTHCIYLLVLCSQALARRVRRPALGFADTAAAAFSTGPRRFRHWAPFAREFVNAALFCTYYFGNTVYVVLVAASFKQVADTHLPPEYHYSVRAWILGLAVPIVPLGIIRTLRLLVPFSAVATAFILVGLGCTMSFVITGASLLTTGTTDAVASASHQHVGPSPLPDLDSRPFIAPIAHMPLFFATVLFAMEGIGTVLPIENSMRSPQKFLGRYGVLNGAMTLVVLLYSMAGFLGYLRFGDATDGSITLNLPNDLFAEMVKIMVALSILFSYGLQFCVPSEIVWTRLEPRLRRYNWFNQGINDSNATARSNITTAAAALSASEEKKRLELEDLARIRSTKRLDLAYYVMRASMILGTVLIAALVPDLAPFISLIGAVFFSILGLMCPALIHLVTFWEQDVDDECDETCYVTAAGYSNAELDFDPADVDYYYAEYPDEEGGKGTRRGRRCGDKRKKSGVPSGMSSWEAAKDVCIVIVALVALVSGTYASLVDIVAFYGGEEGSAAAAAATTMATSTIGAGPESAALIVNN